MRLPARASTALTLVTLAVAQSGRSTCPCVDNVASLPSLAQYRRFGSLRFNLPGVDQQLSYPVSYGEDCHPHDQNKPPVCDQGAESPSWCATSWCYVDPDQCSGVSAYQSRYFPDAQGLHFSYSTCTGTGAGQGGSDVEDAQSSAARWSGQDLQATREIIGTIESYARGTRHLLEQSFAQAISNNETVTDACEDQTHDMCHCPSCQTLTTWDSSLDFSIVGTKRGPDDQNPEEIDAAMCMSAGVSSSLLSIAAIESDQDRAKVGYMYFGDQRTGTYTQWPTQQWNSPGCDAEDPQWDPRFRPWYAAGATGPKDVVIVVDVSGSMFTNDRHKLAKAATLAVLNVLTWKDFATIVLFNAGIEATYSETLVPVTEANRDAMIQWCERQEWMRLGTNFRTAFQRGFDIVERSVQSGETSMCQKAMLFLTDGDASLDDSDFDDIRRRATMNDMYVFTYSLGADANVGHMKRAACENRGVFHRVEDNANVPKIMSSFYNFFVQGQELCSASFVKYSTFNEGQESIAACLPMYNRTTKAANLLGVTCMDVGLIADVPAMRREAGWDHFVCQASDATKQCRPLELSECHRQKVRLAFDASSVCEGQETVTLDTQCSCISPSCQDDADWVDEKGYFCDTWIGDDCDTADIDWDYSQAGMAAVLEKCPRSCGRCEILTPQQCANRQASTLECSTSEVRETCRACRGRVSGVNMENELMSDAACRLCPESCPATTTPPSAIHAVGACSLHALVQLVAATVVASSFLA